MLKKIIKLLLKVLLALVLLYAAGRFVVVYTDSELRGERAPYIQMPGSDSVVIHWLSEQPQPSIVHYGEDRHRLDQIYRDETAVNDHIVSLQGLKPGTRYYYQVGDGQIGAGQVGDGQVGADQAGSSQAGDTGRQWFYTSPNKPVPTRIWVIGDSGEAGETLEQVYHSAVNWMQQHPKPGEPSLAMPAPLIDVWIALGDIAYRSGTNEQYQAALFDTFSDLTGNTALWPVYGNHDERRWTYFRIFDLPQDAEAGGVASHTENYYAIDYGDVHFIMLDSQESDRAADGEMAEWLERDLAQNKKPWVIAVFHHPPYSKGTHDSDNRRDSWGRMQDMRENFLPILEKYGVDLVLSGHSHMYERSYFIDCAYEDSTHFSPKNIVSHGTDNRDMDFIKPLQEKAHQGSVYVVAGSASKVDNGPMDHPAHAVGLLEAGSMIIDIDGDSLDARFINDEGEVRDHFTITKQAGYNSGYEGCQ